ncbi:MAG TPA: arylsulfatase [Candidatus Hydrogenedens sp.]|nr:arylsulfatase [Candidatus Hydrogenedens sp.]
MRKYTRRSFLGNTLTAGVAFNLFLNRNSMTQEQVEKPNFIIILADDLGYGDVGCYGQENILTPNIDRLAREGMIFTDGYAGSTVCAPSRCCLMTGLHTGHARIRGNGTVSLAPEDVTMAEVLKSQGYVTGLVGKWGLGEAETSGIPTLQGFDEFYGYLNQVHAHNYYPDFLWRGTKKEKIEGNIISEVPGVCSTCTQYSHDLLTKEAIDFIQRNKSKNFFLYLSLTIPHANNELGNAKGNGMEVPNDEPYSDRPWPQIQKNHAAMITRLDDTVGRVLDLLNELGLDEKTVILFSSDNGPHKEGGADPEFFKSSGPFKGYKRALYEGGIRVSFIVRWKGKVASGAKCDVPCAFWDVLPTFAELSGAKVPQGIDGVSMVPLIFGNETSSFKNRPLYWEFYEQGFKQALRIENWKLVNIYGNAPELYDLSNDKGENNNLASSYPDKCNELLSLLKGLRIPSQDWKSPMD